MTPASEPVRCPTCGSTKISLFPNWGSCKTCKHRGPRFDFVPPTPKEVRLIDLEQREEYGEEVRE